MLDAATRTPLGADAHRQAMVEVKGPKGETVASGAAQVRDSVAGLS